MSGPRRVFHVAPADALTDLGATGGWERGGTGTWSPPSLAAEGYVHLSYADQLAGTLAAHFATAPPQRLLEVSPAAVADALRVEPSRGGELFPHLYRALRAGDLLRWWPLEQREGAWSLPRLGHRPAQDAPAGTPIGG